MIIEVDNGEEAWGVEINIHKAATDLDVLLKHFKNINGYECMTTVSLMMFLEELAKGESNENGASNGQVG